MKLSKINEVINNLDNFIIAKELSRQKINGETFIFKRESSFKVRNQSFNNQNFNSPLRES